ncbi:MAG TPA: xanthine dehydrogenase accessory protein XdhC [Bacteroidetes bacterium]|nr:putative xanthine dehydrogenase subunit A [bacterium BMS3Bbin04]HDO64465.1 xanthine dehydrogenase accessory protein XdhC [Bacteroidota bacterium]HEX03590.1 xanthine dehydrogenase accessory protein XdhC [Bacteroidota bacterium]
MINSEVWIEAGQLAAQGQMFCIAVLSHTKGSVPRRAGSTMLIRSDGSTIGTIGGGSVERQAAEEALQAMASGETRTQEYDLIDPDGDGICGGKVTVLLLPQMARMTLHLFGAGHVARPLCKLAAMTGYAVTVYDEIDDWATPANFPESTHIQTGDLTEITTELETGPLDAVVILTGSHKLDLEILRRFKDNLPSYIGVIASRKKAAFFRKNLVEDGWSREDIKRIHTPIGLDISSRTPSEIAVSIIAEIMKERGPVE